MCTKTQASFDYFLMMTRLQRKWLQFATNFIAPRWCSQAPASPKLLLLQILKKIWSFLLTHSCYRVGVKTDWRVVKIHVFRWRSLPQNCSRTCRFSQWSKDDSFLRPITALIPDEKWRCSSRLFSTALRW